LGSPGFSIFIDPGLFPGAVRTPLTGLRKIFRKFFQTTSRTLARLRFMTLCPLCRIAAVVAEEAGASGVQRVDCGCCGAFRISQRARDAIGDLPVDAPGRTNLICATRARRADRATGTFWLANGEEEREPGAQIVRVEDQLTRPIQHAAKPSEILRAIARKLSQTAPFEYVTLPLTELRDLRIGSKDEATKWLMELVADGCLEQMSLDQFRQYDESKPSLRLTAKGWERAEKLFGNVESSVAFIAMSFELSERAKLQETITRACQANGWAAETVDQTHYMGGVVDQIIAQMRRSRFVVADFTEHRPSVYFEAGFAEGAGIPAIYTVKKDQMKQANFDTRHINHIAWDDFSDLERSLEARVGALFGPGPRPRLP
jgi:DNA-binding MarR family transcriptional regulator